MAEVSAAPVTENLVRSLYRKGDVAAAEEKAYDLYLSDSDNLSVRKLAFAVALRRASGLYRQKDYETLLEIARRAQLYKSSDYRPKYYEGLAYKGLQRLDEAKDSLLASYSLSPSSDGKNNLVTGLGDICYRQENFAQAKKWFEEQVSLSGKNPVVAVKIATCLWRTGDTAAAVVYLKDVRLDFPNDRGISRLLKKLSRENAVEEDYRQVVSGDFFISFERTTEQTNVKDRLARMLSGALKDVERSLWRHNGNMIHVVLYPSGQEYMEALNAPNWSAACWNGKLRIPVETAKSAREEKLIPLLRHELVHFVLREKYMWKPLPGWLDEGLAQVNEGEEKYWARNLLRPIVNRKDAHRYMFTFRELEPGFSRIRSGNSARVAYAQALWAVKYLNDLRWSYAVDILDYVSEGYSTEDALYRVTGENYDQFTQSWLTWLRKKFKLREQ